jgi:hypothetical protein
MLVLIRCTSYEKRHLRWRVRRLKFEREISEKRSRWPTVRCRVELVAQYKQYELQMAIRYVCSIKRYKKESHPCEI